MDDFAAPVRVVRLQIHGRRHAADVVDADRVSAARFLDATNREIDVAVAEVPPIPKPVQISGGDVVDGVEEIPGNRVLAVPPIHEGVQRVPERRIAQHVLEREVAECRLAVRIVSVSVGAQSVGRRDDGQVLERGRIIAPTIHPELLKEATRPVLTEIGGSYEILKSRGPALVHHRVATLVDPHVEGEIRVRDLVLDHEA